MWKEIRKFGLEFCDLPTMLWNVAVMLRVLAVNIDNRHTKGIPFYYYIITLVAASSYFYVFLISLCWFVFYRCARDGEMVHAMVILSLGVSSEIGTFKLFYMIVHIVKIRKLADGYLECDARVSSGSRFSNNLLQTMRKVKKRAIIYWMVLVVNGILFLLKPALTPGNHLPHDFYVIYGLEPALESPNYEVTFLMISAGVFFICYVPANVTAFLIVIAGYTEAQMLALSEEMLHLWSDAVSEAEAQHFISKNSEVFKAIRSTDIVEEPIADDDVNDVTKSDVINKIISRRLKHIIKRHTVILNLYFELENIFRGAIVMGFFPLILGLIAELLGGLENTYMQMPFAYMQVYMDCFLGQRVMDASVAFERAIYEAKWEKYDKSNMKMVLVMLQNSQKTMSMSAGGIATLSFSCLMTVTRAIYSAYTTLRTTMK